MGEKKFIFQNNLKVNLKQFELRENFLAIFDFLFWLIN